MAFSREQVERVAHLARLRLSEDEIGPMAGQLDAILGYVAQLNKVNTDGVEPLAHCLPIDNVFREDRVGESLPVDAALANAPKRVGAFYAVPAILD